jgi:hypothetical protein
MSIDNTTGQDYQLETDTEKWLNAARKVHGKNVTTHLVKSGVFQEGYEYLSEIVATLNGIEVAKYVFDVPTEKEINYEYEQQEAA